MTTRTALALILAAGILAGCTTDSSTEPPPGPSPSGVTEAEPNDTTPQAAGTLGDSTIVINGTATSAADVDRYSFALPVQRTFTASLSWTGGADLDLGVANGSGVLMAFRDTGGNPESCTLPSRPSGTYVLQVTSKSTASQAYRLTLTPR